jgi:hypothetical protein
MNRADRNRGYALITAVVLTAVTTVLVIGFYNQVITEMKISRNDTDYSEAFYAAEAGLEKLNSDLSKLFLTAVFPTQAALEDLMDEDHQPVFPGVTFGRYELNGGQSAKLTAALTAVATTASVDSTDGWPDTGGFMIDGEELTYTGKTSTTFTGLARGQDGSIAAAHTNNAVVFRSKNVTLSEGANAGLSAQMIPFTLDVTARAGVGAEARLTREVQVALIPVFQFGIFSDSALSFFAGPNFNFGGRVHSNGNIFLAEGNSGTLTLAQKITSAGDIIRQYLANGVSTGTSYTGVVNVATAPSVYRALGLTEGSVTGGPGSGANSSWPGLSLSTYNKNILSASTGAKPLTLPFVAEGYSPIELIRRPPEGEDTGSLMGQSRLANQASLRVFLSDSEDDIPGGNGYLLDNTNADYIPVDGGGEFRPPFAEARPADPDFITAAGADETTSAPLIGGYIYIERHNTDDTWTDVTMEILNLGISTNQTNAILRFQKLRWDAANSGNSLTATDYVPINMYDAREGRFRDVNSSVGSNLRKLGIMNLVELDVRKLKDWFAGTIGDTGTDALSNNGYIFYFSDRRGNRDDSGEETAELGFEDFVNAGDVNGDPNDDLETGEDLNENEALETYGANLPYNPYTPSTDIWATAVPYGTANLAMDISEQLDNSETDIEVSVGASVTVPGYYRIDGEIVDCTSKSGNTLTCTRGALGTVAAAHTQQYIDIQEDLTTTDTSIDVSSSAGLVFPNFYRINAETVHCTSAAGNTLTCTRGRLGTTASTHSKIDRTNSYVVETLDTTETGIDIGGGTTNITVPGFFEINGAEIVRCTTKSGTAITGCTRGSVGTAAAAVTYATSDLRVDLNTTNTTITVASVASFPVPRYYRIENEIINCTSKVDNASGNDTMTCSRGQQGTAAAAHDADDAAINVKTQFDVRALNVWKINLLNSRRAAVNKVHYFRRAIRLYNGTSPNLPEPGFTVVAENPLYVMGNYNSNGDTSFNDAHSYAAVIADAVSLLSNSWVTNGDDRSFNSPYSPGGRSGSTTFYRMAIAAGKGINFDKPDEESIQDFGTDGGAHNFLRYLESWSGSTAYYRGSIVSLYYYRQSVGPYKCCGSVYGPPTRNYAFDTDFLVPSKLPPGTPKFRDINNLSFRQTIRADTD